MTQPSLYAQYLVGDMLARKLKEAGSSAFSIELHPVRGRHISNHPFYHEGRLVHVDVMSHDRFSERDDQQILEIIEHLTRLPNSYIATKDRGVKVLGSTTTGVNWWVHFGFHGTHLPQFPYGEKYTIEQFRAKLAEEWED